MGTILNWRMPIEWDDGTAASIDPAQHQRISDGEALSAYYVRSAREPRGWNRRTMPKLGMSHPVMVNPDGTLDCDAGSNAPRVVNTQMPLLRTEGGDEPVGGRITNDGTRLTLTFAGGDERSYTWPTLRPMAGSPKLVEITPAMVEAEEKAVVEQAAMEENPWFGSF